MNSNYHFDNLYSKANVSAFAIAGGLMIFVDLKMNQNLLFSNSFSSASVTGNEIGAIIGKIPVYSLGNLSFSQVYWDNLSLNCTSSLTAVNSAIPINSSTLTFNIQHYFDSSIWCGQNLLVEPIFNFLPCPFTSFPSTFLPSTLVSTTQSLSSQTPSTFSQTPNLPSSVVLSQIPTTQIWTSIQNLSLTTTSLNCFYQVPNCQFCSQNPPKFDQTQFNISCSFIQGEWICIFKNKTSDTIYNNFTIILNGTTNYIEGNFTQTSSGQIVFVISTNQNKSIGLNVSGCVSINGTIQIVLNTQP